MELLFQEQTGCNVRWADQTTVKSEVMRLSTSEEMRAQLLVNVDTFHIEKAEWESYRQGTHYKNENRRIQALEGTAAYFGIGPVLARAFPSPNDQSIRSMFAECVKGMIQAETYLYHHRGFADSTAYQKNWDTTHPGTCLYYSNLDSVDRRWFEYIGPEIRTGHLFQRGKSVAVWKDELGGAKVTGSFLDSFHELGLTMDCSPTGSIIACRGNFLRAPGRICFETAAKAASCVGMKLQDTGKTKLAKCLGGAHGCAHLLDLAHDMSAAVVRETKRV